MTDTLIRASMVNRFSCDTETQGREVVSCKRSPASAVAVAAIVCALLDFSSRVAAQPEAGQSLLPDIQKLGPQVGTHVPDFVLLDQTKQLRTLKSLMGPKGLMLMFFRSADW